MKTSILYLTSILTAVLATVSIHAQQVSNQYSVVINTGDYYLPNKITENRYDHIDMANTVDGRKYYLGLYNSYEAARNEILKLENLGYHNANITQGYDQLINIKHIQELEKPETNYYYTILVKSHEVAKAIEAIESLETIKVQNPEGLVDYFYVGEFKEYARAVLEAINMNNNGCEVLAVEAFVKNQPISLKTALSFEKLHNQLQMITLNK